MMQMKNRSQQMENFGFVGGLLVHIPIGEYFWFSDRSIVL